VKKDIEMSLAGRLIATAVMSGARPYVLAMAAVLALSSCGPPRAPQFADPSLGEVGQGEVVLMPVVDQRENRLDQFDVGRHVTSAADKVLAKKGYTVLTGRHLEGFERLPFEGFSTLSAGELSQLGPKGSTLLLFIAVDGVTREYERYGDEYRVRLSGLLVDRDSERVIWRDSGSGATSFGGFLAIMSPAGSQYDAVHDALMNLLRTVPDYSEEAPPRRRARS
jgi:hypothetical protein